jgi:hypothetical protein
MQLAPPLPTDNGARDLSLALFSRLATHYTPILLVTRKKKKQKKIVCKLFFFAGYTISMSSSNCRFGFAFVL